jgi:hypothetical protein
MSRGFSPLAYAGFSTAFRPWMKRRISGISISPPRSHILSDVPLMLVANHVSWWDGFLLIELQRMLRPHAPFHTIMLESELRRSPFLRRIGAIGVDPDSVPSVLSAMRELARRTEERPDSMIFFFPQGRIWPSYRRPLGFKRGIEVFCKAIGDVVVIPVGIHIEPLNHAAPSAFVYAGKPLADIDAVSARPVERLVEGELDRILQLLMQHGEDAGRVAANTDVTNSPRLPFPPQAHRQLHGSTV